MKRLQLLVGFTAVGFALAAACGGESGKSAGDPDGGGDNVGASGEGGSGPSGGGSSSTLAGAPGSGAMSPGGGGEFGGASAFGGAGAEGGVGGAPTGCGDFPLCDEDTQQCVAGHCLLQDGQNCTANSQCAHTCIGGVCAPRADVLETCDFVEPVGEGGSGGSGGGSGGTDGGPEAGANSGGAPPAETGNGDDTDCLPGLGCDSGDCKRKITSDCTSSTQCLSGLCHDSKCTPRDPGSCVANECGVPDSNLVCQPTTLAANRCAYNYLPNAACTFTTKGTACASSCACELTP